MRFIRAMVIPLIHGTGGFVNNMSDVYQDKTYIKSSLVGLAEAINDMEIISVYNQDVANDELARMKLYFNEAKKKILEIVK